MQPLEGLRFTASGGSCPVRTAAWFLSNLGARPCSPDQADFAVGDGTLPGAVPGAIVTELPPSTLRGVPPGTVEYATGLALAGAAAAAGYAGTVLELDAALVAAQVFLPVLLATSRQDHVWPRPPPPLMVPDGALSCELGGDGDREAFDRLIGSLRPRAYRAEEMAQLAQEWRLPVVAYRPRSAQRRHSSRAPVVHGIMWGLRNHVTAQTGLRPPARALGARPPLDGAKVTDLTSMWAGPLATWWLAALGAEVTKVEAECRFDGMRLDTRAFVSLNRNKRSLLLDLREETARRQMQHHLESSDLLVSSFSPRVLPNFGMHPRALTRAHRQLIVVSMPAFPPRSRRRQWVSYGGGVHAASGLGDLGRGEFAAPAVTYPDPVGGIAAFATSCALLLGRAQGWSPRPAEVPLLSAVRPLLQWPRRRWTVATPEVMRTAVQQIVGPERTRLPSGYGPPAPFRGAGLPIREVLLR